MPVFFIDSSDERLVVTDAEGQSFDTLDDAKHAAIELLPAMLDDSLSEGGDRVLSATIRDEEGRSLLRATLTLNIRYLPVTN